MRERGKRRIGEREGERKAWANACFLLCQSYNVHVAEEEAVLTLYSRVHSAADRPRLLPISESRRKA